MLKPLAVVALLLTVGLPLSSAIATKAIPSQAVAASPWEPIARINPRKPFQVQLDNQAGTTLEYASTTNEFSPRRLASGGTTVLNRLPLPVYLLISPINPRFNLKYRVSVNQNSVYIRVQQLPENRPGNTTINIQETGGIFVY